MNPFLLVFFLAQVATVPPSTGGAEPAPTCAALDRSLPPALAGWSRNGERLMLGHAVTLQGEATPTPPRGRPGHGATIAFSVPIDGTYGIALNQDGWIEMEPVMDRGPGTPIAAVGHDHGSACSSVRKIVRFELNAATYYSLSLSGLSNPVVRVMLVAPPPPEPPAH